MAILRDIFCTACGYMTADYWCASINVMRWMFTCEHCGEFALHKPIANGGLRSRWRYCDFSEDPTDYFGQTDHSVAVIDEHTGEDVKSLEGDVIHQRDKYTHPDVRGEKRDRAEHKVKAERGKNPIYSNLG
jgi:hypothetical protein